MKTTTSGNGIKIWAFTSLPSQLLDNLLVNKELSLNEKRILIFLIGRYYINRGLPFQTPHIVLTTLTGLTRRTIHNILKKLRKLDFIEYWLTPYKIKYKCTTFNINIENIEDFLNKTNNLYITN